MTVIWKSRPVPVWLYMAEAFLLGITAIPSGALMVIDPSGSMIGLEVQWLASTPFRNYFIPGLILLGVLGIGSFVVLYGIERRREWAWWAAVGLGITLIGWIITQVLLLQMYHALHRIYGVLGITLFILAGLPSVRSYLGK